jgi:hypothetical protein
MFNKNDLTLLKSDEKITVLSFNDFGGLYAIQGKLVSVIIRDWAQYKDAIYLTFIPKGKRKARSVVFHDHKTFAIYKNHIALNTELPKEYRDGFVIQTMKFMDKERFESIMNTSNETPLYIHRG